MRFNKIAKLRFIETQKVSEVIDVTASVFKANRCKWNGQTKNLIDLSGLVVPPRIELGSKV